MWHTVHTEKEGDDYEKEMGELGEGSPDEIDRNMWAPEEKEQEYSEEQVVW